MSLSPKNHLYSIDVIRLISALAIIIIHVTGSIFNQYQRLPDNIWYLSLVVQAFFRWGTPLFIMISGYLLLGSDTVKNPKIFYRRRLSRLFIPILFWTSFYYYLNVFYNPKAASFAQFLDQMWHANTYYHLYFLFLISGLYFISPFLRKLIDKNLNLDFVVPSLVVLSNVYLFASIWFNLPKFNTATTWFFLYIGYYLAGYWLSCKDFKIKWWYWLSLLLPLVGSYFDKLYISSYGISDQGAIFTHRLSLLIALPAFFIFSRIIRLDNRFFLKNNLTRLSSFADFSLGVYLVHPAILNLINSLSFFDHLQKVSPLFWSLLTLSLVFTLSLLLVSCLKRLPLLNKLV